MGCGLHGMRSAWDELEEGRLVHHIWRWSGARLCCGARGELSTSDGLWLLWGRGRALGPSAGLAAGSRSGRQSRGCWWCHCPALVPPSDGGLQMPAD